MLSRFQAEPLRALIWIETAAFSIAFCSDVILGAAVRLPGTPLWPPWIGLYAILLAGSALAIFSIPHAPNRRYAAIVLGGLGVAASGMIPSPGLTPFVLLIILAARLTFAFGFRGAAIAWSIACVAIVANAVANIFHTGHTGAPRLSAPTFAFLIYEFSLKNAQICAVIGIMWLYARKAADSAASAERMRIALDLHDSLGHGLTTLSVQLQNAQRLRAADAHKADGYVDRAAATTAELLGDVRETVAILHDDAQTQTQPLLLLLERLRADFSSTHDVRISWNVGLPSEPSGRIAMAIYHVLQEALTNVARHANASHINVEVIGCENRVELKIWDDGRGFSGEPASGHGLMSMRMRVESLGGDFEVSSQAGAGTHVRARIPLEAAL